jgi:hypothetical protein
LLCYCQRRQMHTSSFSGVDGKGERGDYQPGEALQKPLML